MSTNVRRKAVQPALPPQPQPEPQSQPQPQRDDGASAPPAVLESWHQRILSAQGGELTLDIRNFRSNEPRIWHQDLREILLFGGVGQGVYQGKVLKLGAFPHLVDALQTALLEDLRIKHRGRPDKSIPLLLGTSTRVFCWMLSTKHYRLQDLKKKRILKLVGQLAESGWYEVLSMRKVLDGIVQQATESPNLAVRLMPRADRKTSRGINIRLLRELTGLPFTGPEVPMEIREALFALAKRPWPTEDTLKASGYAKGSSLKITLECFNRLSLQQSPADCLPFLPFPSVSAEMKRLGKKPSEQTPNLSLDDAARIFRACITWLYDRAPVLLEIAAAARQVFEQRGHEASAGRLDRAANDAARAAAARYITPDSPAHWLRNLVLKSGATSLARHLYMVYVAAACQTGINHGRRVNEVVGEKLPYGLYFGCVRPVANVLHEWRIDIYCEKNTQAYRSFPANALVADAVSVLEKLANLLRPLNTPSLEKKADIKTARSQKLFMTRYVTAGGFNGSMFDIDFREYLKAFLLEAGVDPQRFHGAAWPFRRLFASLNTNKYDHPELLALSEHLDHLGVRSTLPYQHDKTERPKGESVKEHLGQHDLEAEGMLREMRQARIEHLLGKVSRMLNGEAVGGFFPRLVRRLAKSLSARADFRKADRARKALTITELLVEHGYLSNPMEHTTCVADAPKATIRLANCYRDGSLHREDACEHTCFGCLHSTPALTQIDRLRQLAKQAQFTAEDPGVPPAVQRASAAHAADFAKLAAAEEKIAQENKKAFALIIQSWVEEVLADG